MHFFDTHCHIHEASSHYAGANESRQRWLKAGMQPADMLADARKSGVTRMVCVGTTVDDSKAAISFAGEQPDTTWASIGIHPHEAKRTLQDNASLQEFKALATQPQVVAVGECGLDYYYNHSPKREQVQILELQLQLASDHNLPLIFHVRNAFPEFWPVYDNFSGLRGVIHSFTATQVELEDILKRDLYVGLNGIMTFTKDQAQLGAAKAAPLDRMVLETDAPFLTPVPYRGNICQPKHVVNTAEFLSGLRNESIEMLSRATADNARRLFNV